MSDPRAPHAYVTSIDTPLVCGLCDRSISDRLHDVMSRTVEASPWHRPASGTGRGKLRSVPLPYDRCPTREKVCWLPSGHEGGHEGPLDAEGDG